MSERLVAAAPYGGVVIQCERLELLRDPILDLVVAVLYEPRFAVWRGRRQLEAGLRGQNRLTLDFFDERFDAIGRDLRKADVVAADGERHEVGGTLDLIELRPSPLDRLRPVREPARLSSALFLARRIEVVDHSASAREVLCRLRPENARIGAVRASAGVAGPTVRSLVEGRIALPRRERVAQCYPVVRDRLVEFLERDDVSRHRCRRQQHNDQRSC